MINQIIEKSLIQYGDIAEMIVYKTPLYRHLVNRISYAKNISDERDETSLSRTRNTLYRLIYANVYHQKEIYKPVFLTLTYSNNETSIRSANQDFGNFIKRLNYFLDCKTSYICIPEFQKRGAIHYHVIFFNLPFIDKSIIQDIWGHGYTRIELSKHINNLAAYMAKYMSKDIVDSRLAGHRLLLTSKHLQKPQTYYNDDVDFFSPKLIGAKMLSREDSNNKIKYKYQIV